MNRTLINTLEKQLTARESALDTAIVFYNAAANRLNQAMLLGGTIPDNIIDDAEQCLEVMNAKREAFSVTVRQIDEARCKMAGIK